MKKFIPIGFIAVSFAFTTSLAVTKIDMKAIPSEVLDKCKDESGRIANIGEPWESSDALTSYSKPRSRLTSACKNKKGDWMITCDLGGYGIQHQIFIAIKNSDGKWQIEKVSYKKAEEFKCEGNKP